MASSQDSSRMSVYDVPVDSDSAAVMLLIQFLDMATKRGAFGLDDTQKIGQCINYLNRRSSAQSKPAAAPSQSNPAAPKTQGNTTSPPKTRSQSQPSAPSKKPNLN